MKRINLLLLSFFSSIFVLQSVSVSSQNLPKWGIVFGSDTTIEDAKREINHFNGSRVDLSKYRNKAVIFLRDGKLRSVLLFNTEQEARASRDQVEAYLNNKDKEANMRLPRGRGSYVVNLGPFCPGWFIKKKTTNNYPGVPYFECNTQSIY